MSWTENQKKVIDSRGGDLLVAAAAGSGKTAVLVERILSMICDSQDPVEIDQLLIVTFTRAAASEMRERIRSKLEERLKENPSDERALRQRSLLSQAKISTIDSFCLELVRTHFYELELDPGFRPGDPGEMELMKQDVLEEMLQEEYSLAVLSENGEESEEDEQRDRIRKKTRMKKRILDSGSMDSSAFLRTASRLSTARSDARLQDCILKLHRFSESAAWPEEWLKNCLSVYQIGTEEELLLTPWLTERLSIVQKEAASLQECYDKIRSLCLQESGPSHFWDAFSKDSDLVNEIAEAENYTQAWKLLKEFRFQSKPRAKKSDTHDPDLAEQAASLREECKEIIKGWQKEDLFYSASEILDQIRNCRETAEELVRLTVRFSNAYNLRKREKNVFDFSDIEHFALQILSDGEGENASPSATAVEYREKFREIMIDEYQDSNDVQEQLLSLISGSCIGKPNRFMVGDVKQSIYAFRLARPEIFMQKYASYGAEGDCRKIELQQNFRSRPDVLYTVNYLFHQIMRSDLGNVEYDRAAALYPGALFEECSREAGGRTELLLVSKNGAEDAEEQKNHDSDDWNEPSESASCCAQELEAAAIAERILELTDPDHALQVWDKEQKEYRNCEPGDIVILLRGMNQYADYLVRILNKYGIGAAAESQKGYFDVWEVQILLSLLQILDNPLQNIPLAAVLHSPIGKLSSQDLAVLKVTDEKENGKIADGRGLFGILERAEEAGRIHEYAGGDALADRVIRFMNLYRILRTDSVTMSVPELLRRIFDLTGFADLVTAMPGGDRRRANLVMLVSKAESFEKTSYSGLFQFVRYIHRIREYDIDFGEAEPGGNSRETVRIMTIHKSKGLEFPVVFLAGIQKKFNQSDSRDSMICHVDYGLALDDVDLSRRIRTKTFLKKTFAKKILLDQLGEELRLLYVALTRAKEKLILSGVLDSPEELIGRTLDSVSETQEVLPYRVRSKARCYLDWILPAALHSESLKETAHDAGRMSPLNNPLYHGISEYQETLWKNFNWSGFSCRIVNPEDLKISGEGRAERQKREKEQFRIHAETADSSKYDEVLSYNYHYGPEQDLHAVWSVTELKRRETPEDQIHIWQTPVSTGEKNSQNAAERGIAMHHFMELLSFEDRSLSQELQEMSRRRKGQEFLSKRERGLLLEDELQTFMDSTLYERMKRAGKENLLRREKHFVIGVSPEETIVGRNAVSEWKSQAVKKSTGGTASQKFREASCDGIKPRMSGSLMLIQGYIDAFFEEEGELVLVDYKTDRVTEDGVEHLKDHYRVQFDYYKKALEMLTGKRVKERLLYSFALGKAISI